MRALCSQQIRDKVRRTGWIFPEHVERSFLDPENSFVAVRRKPWTRCAKQKFAQLRTNYVRRTFFLFDEKKRTNNNNNITLLPSVNTLIARGMFCGATLIIKHLITAANKHPSKKSFIDKTMFAKQMFAQLRTGYISAVEEKQSCLKRISCSGM